MLVTPDLALFQRGSPHCSISVWQRTSSFLAVSTAALNKTYCIFYVFPGFSYTPLSLSCLPFVFAAQLDFCLFVCVNSGFLPSPIPGRVAFQDLRIGSMAG